MSKLPERIWVSVETPLAKIKSGTWHENPYGDEYIRADVAEAMVAAAWKAASEAADALGMMWWAQYKDRKSPHNASSHREGMSDGAADVARHILQSTPADARAALDRIVRHALRDAADRAETTAREIVQTEGHTSVPLLGHGVWDQIRAAILNGGIEEGPPE